MTDKRKTGRYFEEAAYTYLQNQGYEILEKNFYCRSGEIDLIACEGDEIVFIEVKYRKNKNAGYPEESVTPLKQSRIRKTAFYYLWKKGYPEDMPCRFDVAAVLGNHIKIYKNAF